MRTLQQIDEMISLKVHGSNLPSLEIIFLVFGHLFNRAYVLISVMIGGYFAYSYPEAILKRGNLPEFEGKAIENLKLKTMGGFMIINVVAVLLVLVTTQGLKKVIRRARPKCINADRLINLTLSEKGTHSMPSGDTAQGAVWCGLIQLFFSSHYIMMVLPFVALSRVFYQCHWVGDTVAGAAIGLTWALVVFNNFWAFEPLFMCLFGF